MNHYITVDSIRPGIAAVRRAIIATDAGALAQNVIPLHADCSILRLKEILTNLCVPDELVGVHRSVIITATALLRDVAAELHVPRSIDDKVTAIVEEPGIAIAVLLHIVSGVLIVHAAVHANFKEVVAIVDEQVLAEIGILGGGPLEKVVSLHIVEEATHINSSRNVLFGIGIQIAADVTDVVGVVDVLVPAKVEIFPLVEGRVESHPGTRIPIAVNIHGTAVTDTRLGVIDGGITDGAAVDVGPTVEVPAHLLLGDIVIVIHVEAIVPRTLQSCVTSTDIEGVAVVHHLDEVGHRGLRHIAEVTDA